MRILSLILIALVICGGCRNKKEIQKPNSVDFEILCGKDLPSWKYIQTKEDVRHLQFFKALYDANREFLAAPDQQERIPKAVHFIWIGPRPFPRESVENVRTWMAKNPDWTFYFWTDRQRPLPAPGMQLRKVQELEMLKLKDCYDKSESYAEKSDLLRYEILYNEGGVYVDHDVKCMQAFDPINRAYDFYCAVEMPYTSSLPSCVFTTNNLIGSKAGHPILMRCMDLCAAQWDQIEADYPGVDRDSVLNRVLHRTFWLFGQSVMEMSNQMGNKDIVFPAYFFNAPKDELALYARHLYAGTWHETETPFEKMVRQRLMILSKKSNKTLLCIGVISALNLIGFALLFTMIRKQRRTV